MFVCKLKLLLGAIHLRLLISARLLDPKPSRLLTIALLYAAVHMLRGAATQEQARRG